MDSSLNLLSSMPRFCRPATAGDTIIPPGTGLGAVNRPGRTGNDSLDALRTATTTPEVIIGGVVAPQVTFAGMSPQFVESTN